MIKTDKERLEKVVQLWNLLKMELTNHAVTREDLLQNPFFQWAVTTPVYNIGEQVYQLTPEFKRQHSEVMWSVVSGLRHRLVHDYEGVNWNIIADVIFSDMEGFVAQVREILSKMN